MTDPDDDFGFPLLRLGDKTFSADGISSDVAWVPAGGWWGYASAHKAAADVLVDEAVSGRDRIDSVAPILFLYRHYLELALKALASETARIFGDRYSPNHDLLKAWRVVRSRFSDQDEQAIALQALDILVEEWSSIDPGSFSFRYPGPLKGESFLPDDFDNVNIRQVAERMDQANNLFLALDVGLDREERRRRG